MQKNKKAVREAVRVIGHLLETNGITGSFAVDKYGNIVDSYTTDACKFCLMGAAYVVTNGLNVDFQSTMDLIRTKIGGRDLITRWDCAGNAGLKSHKEIVEILKSA